MISSYLPKAKLSTEQIEQMLSKATAADEMRAAYAAAYQKVRHLATEEGEKSVWLRITKINVVS